MYQMTVKNRESEIVDTGHSLALSTEGVKKGVPLYFNFPFFGKKFNLVNIGANGILSFIDPLPGTGDNFYPETGPNNKALWPQRFLYSIQPFFADLNPTPP